MNDCINLLAQTGSSSAALGLILALATLLFIGGGAFLVMTRRRNKQDRRGSLPALGLIALFSLGLSAVGPLNAAPANAAVVSINSTTATDCAETPSQPVDTPDQTPSPTPTDTPAVAVVTPVTPTLVPAAGCGVESTVEVVATTGIDYTQSRTNNLITVTATAQAGFVITQRAQTSWSLDVTPEPCPCVPSVTLEAPTDTALAEVSLDDGSIYTLDVHSSGSWFQDLQAAGGTWTATGTLTADGTVYGYDVDWNGYPTDGPRPWSTTTAGAFPLSFDYMPTVDEEMEQLRLDYPEVVETIWFPVEISQAVGTVTANYFDGCQTQTLTFDISRYSGGGHNGGGSGGGHNGGGGSGNNGNGHNGGGNN